MNMNLWIARQDCDVGFFSFLSEPADWESCPLDDNITLTCGVKTTLGIGHCYWNFNGSAITTSNNVIGFVTENFNITVPCNREMDNMTLTCQCGVGNSVPPEEVTGYNKILVIEESAMSSIATMSSTATAISDVTTSAAGPCMLIILAWITALGQEPACL